MSASAKCWRAISTDQAKPRLQIRCASFDCALTRAKDEEHGCAALPVDAKTKFFLILSRGEAASRRTHRPICSARRQRLA
jgi:hypothetical protein